MRLKVAFVLLVAFALSLPSQAEEPLSNKDVLALLSQGFGEEVVISKIREAEEVAFALGVEDLGELRNGGASDRVIAAMLERNRPPAESPSPVLPEDLGFGLVKVSLSADGKMVALPLLRGQMSSSGFGGFGGSYMNYPGLRATVRIRDRRPSLLVASREPLSKGQYFLAKLDPDTDDDVRSLKISSAKAGFRAAFGGSSAGALAPDPDWLVSFQSDEESPGLWRISPEVELPPGEHGWFVALGAGPQGGGIFAFAIE